ncbi:MAG TPA: helix-turn-helix domain-containing protein [Flavobacteriales bacterium]|jgi:DNA-binding IclR family transcriptional regulator|nr:helix-turn-helix domain-containing protein [Flavobacteriales bacterium]
MEEHARAVLEYLATMEGHCALPDIAMGTDIPVSTTIHSLEALEELGYVTEQETAATPRCFCITELGRGVLQAERKGR